MRRAGKLPEPAAADDAPARYVLEEQVGFLLRKAQQRATEQFNAVMAPFGVTPTQFAALAKLDDLGPQSQNQLGRLTAMDPATIFSVVGRLARRGWVQLTPAPEDARLVIVALTDDGASAASAMKAVAAEVSARTLAPLSAAEAARFVALLARLG
ncbi:MAG: MarR family transcriptional regulator [Bosea sp.]|jgi:DNA-binding MarR family transcriptional regulator|nr:MarR family transcriptional regulator [Bosea sp. (in: a-proteobacteria)]